MNFYQTDDFDRLADGVDAGGDMRDLRVDNASA